MAKPVPYASMLIAVIVFVQLAMTASGIVGTIGLVFYTFPYLGIIFLPLGFLYYGVSAYYQRTSLECKRLDSIMRSGLYSSFGGTFPTQSCTDLAIHLLRDRDDDGTCDDTSIQDAGEILIFLVCTCTEPML